MATLAQTPTVDTTRNAWLMRAATYASVAVAATLIAAKIVAWMLTDSVSVLSSLIDSLLDAAASVVNLIAVHHALTPADREHRFGHGKAEPLAGLAQAAFIAGSAVLLLLQAGHRLVTPQPIANGEIGIAVMLFSIALTFGLVAFQRYVVARTKSVAISADSLHYRGDVLLNGSVILSLVLSMWLGFKSLDPIFGAAIGVYILFSAYQIARLALDLLMDRELPDIDRARIREIALTHPGVRNVHDMRSRSAGTSIFIQMHLEMEGTISLQTAHEIADAVEVKILAAFPNAEVIIHEDPEGVIEPRRTFAVG
ncbi:MAG: cation diffusion facilitator family transporter [Proteobacteria bacterium]|nr:cation diffusion facilitator family transporter [Pseudomonadota bacterium]